MLEVERIPAPLFPDVRARTPINWAVVCFFAVLGLIHLGLATAAALHQRWEGAVSFLFAFMFLLAAAVALRWTTETAVLPSRRLIRIRTGTRRWRFETIVPFALVSTVRLTTHTSAPNSGLLEIVTRDRTIEFPPAPAASQQALLFAMMLDVPLVKVMGGDLPVADVPPLTMPLTHEASKDGKHID